MAYLGFSVPKSLLDCAGKVGTLFSYGDNFVVLSGNVYVFTVHSL